ncbi:MAG: sensor histidine kinase KdpD [Bryobacteraceae bacterium]
MGASDYCRPSPDELLRRAEAEESQAGRGRLKIFLGYAPRVGKSVRMLDEAFRRQKRGQDVVIGSIQPRGLEELRSRLGNIEVVGDGTLDLAAILQRKPHVCLVDELALSNPPGRGHARRWQDVLVLLEHGITVLTALNLQHVAEQQEAVERITGMRAANSVPEDFIRRADEIVIVDVPPEEVTLGRRQPSQIEELSQLRQLALLLAAEVVELELQRYMDLHGIQQSWGTQERILVCITPRSNARRMIESGSRNAASFHGQLFVVYVIQPDLTRELQESLEANLDLARKLGAELHIIDCGDPIGAILEFARTHRITQIFAGHSQRRRWSLWNSNPLDRLIQAAEGIDVRIFPHPHTR